MQKTGLEKTSNMGTVFFQYDFAKHGGAIGSHVLDDDSLPDNAVVRGGFVEVQEDGASGGAATVELTVEGAGDVMAAAGIAGFSQGFMDVVPDYTAANFIKLTSYKGLTMTIGGADLTAGKWIIALEYTLTE